MADSRRPRVLVVDDEEHITELVAMGLTYNGFDVERDVLPLQREKLKSLAIIGPNAKTARIMGGGSAQVNALYMITPFDGILAKVGESVHVGYELGCTNYKFLPLLDRSLVLAGRRGLLRPISASRPTVGASTGPCFAARAWASAGVTKAASCAPATW